MCQRWARSDFRLAAAACCMLLLLVIMSCPVSGQFFTKSSKSIPRMGRRSEPPVVPSSDLHRHKLFEALVDAYGPNLLPALETERYNHELLGNEVYISNDQPIEGADAEYPVESYYPRNQRSSNDPHNIRDASLAVRAMNTDRYIQHLSSGKPFVSYDRFFYGQTSNQAQNSNMNVGSKVDSAKQEQ